MKRSANTSVINSIGRGLNLFKGDKMTTVTEKSRVRGVGVNAVNIILGLTILLPFLLMFRVPIELLLVEDVNLFLIVLLLALSKLIGSLIIELFQILIVLPILKQDMLKRDMLEQELRDSLSIDFRLDEMWKDPLFDEKKDRIIVLISITFSFIILWMTFNIANYTPILFKDYIFDPFSRNSRNKDYSMIIDNLEHPIVSWLINSLFLIFVLLVGYLLYQSVISSYTEKEYERSWLNLLYAVKENERSWLNLSFAEKEDVKNWLNLLFTKKKDMKDKLNLLFAGEKDEERKLMYIKRVYMLLFYLYLPLNLPLIGFILNKWVLNQANFNLIYLPVILLIVLLYFLAFRKLHITLNQTGLRKKELESKKMRVFNSLPILVMLLYPIVLSSTLFTLLVSFIQSQDWPEWRDVLVLVILFVTLLLCILVFLSLWLNFRVRIPDKENKEGESIIKQLKGSSNELIAHYFIYFDLLNPRVENIKLYSQLYLISAIRKLKRFSSLCYLYYLQERRTNEDAETAQNYTNYTVTTKLIEILTEEASFDAKIRSFLNQVSGVLIYLSETEEDRKILRKIARNYFTPPEILKKIFEDVKKDKLSREQLIDILSALVENESTPPEILKKIYDDIKKDKLSGEQLRGILKALTENKNMPPEILKKIYDDIKKDKLSGEQLRGILKALTENDNTPSETLEEIYDDIKKDKLLREQLGGILKALTENDNTPLETLEGIYDNIEKDKLSEEQLGGILKALAENNNTPSETLEEIYDNIEKDKLSEEQLIGILKALAENNNTPSEILKKIYDNIEKDKLSEEQLIGIQKAWVENNNTPLSILRRVLQEVDETVKVPKKDDDKSRQTLKEILRKSLQKLEKDKYEALGVLGKISAILDEANYKTPEIRKKILQKLGRDPKTLEILGQILQKLGRDPKTLEVRKKILQKLEKGNYKSLEILGQILQKLEKEKSLEKRIKNIVEIWSDPKS